MRDLRSLCVYCGSSSGRNPAFRAAARSFGETLAREGVRLVYGAGDVGLMGELARAHVAAGGEITGAIPSWLQWEEVKADYVQDLIVTEDMHERKKVMYDRADAFAALPGGIGTVEETVEMLTWAQLGRHVKPIVLVNLEGYWNPLLAMLEHVVEEGFASPDVRRYWAVADKIEDVLPTVRAKLAAADGDRPDTVAECM